MKGFRMISAHHIVSRLGTLLAVALLAPQPARSQVASAPGTAPSIPVEYLQPDSPPIYGVPRLDKPVTIDGKLDEPAWQTVPPMGRLYCDSGVGPMTCETVARMARDERFLYLAVECLQPDIAGVKFDKGSRDKPSAKGQTIELFLQADRASDTYVQVVFDMSGAFLDQRVTCKERHWRPYDTSVRPAPDLQPEWNGDITAAAAITSRGWIVEARLRLADLAAGQHPDPHFWRGNIARNIADECASWARVFVDFHQPDAFGLLGMSDESAALASASPPPPAPIGEPVTRDAKVMRELLGDGTVDALLKNLKCPHPTDPRDLALLQLHLDRLRDKMGKQPVAQPLAYASRVDFHRFRQVAEAVRRIGRYTADQRGYFEAAIRSPVDGSPQPYTLFVPLDYEREPQQRYPLIVCLHGANGTHSGENGFGPSRGKYQSGYLFMRPMARGPFSGYAGVPGNDVVNQVRDVIAHYRIDPDRVHLFGGSMGGHGAYCIGSTYPDLFATCLVYCGSATEMPLEQMCNLPTFIHHGLGDLSVTPRGAMFCAAMLRQAHAPVQLYLYPVIGHDPRLQVATQQIMPWSARRPIRRDRCPRRVILAGEHPSLKKAYWLSILRYADLHEPAHLEATFLGKNHLALDARNVAWARIDLPCDWIAPDSPLLVAESSGNRNTTITPGDAQCLYLGFTGESLQVLTSPPMNFDDPTVYTGGGACDIFWTGRPIRIVYGTAGSADQTDALAKLATDLRRWNAFGGGDFAWGGYPVFKDTDVTGTLLDTCDLVLLGTPADNSVVHRVMPQLPVQLADGTVVVNVQPRMQWPAEQVSFSLFYRNPLAPARRIWWFAGPTDRQTFQDLARASHDYVGPLGAELIVQSKKEHRILATAQLDSQWRLHRPTPTQPGREIWPTPNDLNQRFRDALLHEFAPDINLAMGLPDPEILDWNTVTVGEILYALQPAPMLLAPVYGKELIDRLATKPRDDNHWDQIQYRGLQHALRDANLPADDIEPDRLYTVLFDQASLWTPKVTGRRLPDPRFIPAAHTQTVLDRVLRAAGITQPAPAAVRLHPCPASPPA
ncbi:MAG TPA: PHB depolymerase family esterase [Phycisphaerae bacterium]|nr:PHB depolymerase family esterase [Phycisphaerae bacterium]